MGKCHHYFEGRADAYKDAIDHILEIVKLRGGRPFTDDETRKSISQAIHDFRVFATSAYRTMEEVEKKEIRAELGSKVEDFLNEIPMSKVD